MKCLQDRSRLRSQLYSSGRRPTCGGDKDRDAFIDYIAQNPEAGDTIPDTGGVRKIRWSRPGMGKRGGVRVIYFYHDAAMPLYLLLIYAKAQQENWTPEDRRRVRTVVDAVKLLHGRS